MKEVAIPYCDFCDMESGRLNKCGVCKRDMCTRENGNAHVAYTIIQIRKPPKPHEKDDTRSFDLRVCKDCAKETFNMPFWELVDGMMQDEFSFEKFKVRKGC